MAGQTPNANILKALDELIKAVNDQSLTCAPEVNVQSATPDVNVTCPPPVTNVNINCSCGGCGGGGSATGTKLEDPPVTETDPPPPGGEPDPNIDDRKCKAANLIYDGIYGSIQKLQIYGADNYRELGFDVVIVLVSTLIGAGGGSVIPFVGTLVGAVAGAVIGIVVSLVSSTSISLGDILIIMVNTHNDLICALYNAADTTQAKNDFISILVDGGLNNVEEQTFVGYFLFNDVTKVLFQRVTIGGQDSEAILDGYEVSVECGVCGPNECETNENDWTFAPEYGNVTGSIVAGELTGQKLTPIEGWVGAWKHNPVGDCAEINGQVVITGTLIEKITAADCYYIRVTLSDTTVIQGDTYGACRIQPDPNQEMTVVIPAEHAGKTISEIALIAEGGPNWEGTGSWRYSPVVTWTT
jgi:uncharacterized protein (DUF697 family)